MPKDYVVTEWMPFTGVPHSFDYGGGSWVFEVSLIPMKSNTNEAGQWLAWFRAQKNGYGTFAFGDPQRTTALGTATGSPLVNGSGQSVGSTSLVTDGWTNNISNIMRRGDYFALESNLYMVTEDANSGASTGPATLTIWPPLRKSPADNAALTVSSPTGIFKMRGMGNFAQAPGRLIAGEPFVIQDVPQL
jgi:hypothetical protein